jgi:competence protein ComEC
MFRYFVLGFVCCVYAFYQLGTFPSGWSLVWLCAGLVSGWAIFRFARLKQPVNHVLIAVISPIIIGLLFGYIWVFSHSFLTDRLPNAIYFKPVTVVGKVVDLPQVNALTKKGQASRVKFLFELQRLAAVDSKFDQAWSFWQPTVQLSWYDAEAVPKSGEVWRFQVKLKPRHASLNPGAFDYETYLFQKGVQGYGYVLDKGVVPVRLSEAGVFGLRNELADHLQRLFAESPFQGVFQALIDGDKSDIGAEDWRIMQRTGTIHLMAISGLHIAIIAGLGFALFGWIWRWGIRWTNWAWWWHTPKIVFASWGGILTATLYMAMAGFSIPTQRAWLMVVTVLLFVLIRRKFQPWSALALAAFLIVLWHPPSVLSQGFWLSFTAVAIIFAVLRWPTVQRAPGWQKLLWIQLGLTVGLAPALAGYYHQIALGSFLANLLAVPFVSLLGLPLLFLTVLVSFVSDTAAHGLMWLNDQFWSGLWWALQWISDRLGFWVVGQLQAWQIVLLYAVLFWTVGVRTVDGQKRKWLGGVALVGLTVVFLWHPFKPVLAPGEFRVTVLDVGQGQALVFETETATVVYDTGARWSDKMDGAKLALLPYLKSQNRSTVELLIVSHSDSDHAGGVASLLQDMAVTEAVSGQAEVLNQGLEQAVFQPCRNGQAWSFSDVRFEMLSPADSLPQPTNDNDASCVLRVTNDVGTVLVPGDLTERMEKPLVAAYEDELQADLLVAGHHGSRTSTSQAWLNAVSPQEVVFSSGFANRFHFPTETVLKRLEDEGIPWRNTACRGAIQYKITLDSERIYPSSLRFVNSARQARPRWYANECEAFAETRDKAGR